MNPFTRIGDDFKLPLKIVSLLILSSLLNAAICVGSFLFGAFATNPEMQDVTMRVGFYVLNVIVVAAFVGSFVPWIFALKKRHKGAINFATLPTLLA